MFTKAMQTVAGIVAGLVLVVAAAVAILYALYMQQGFLLLLVAAAFAGYWVVRGLHQAHRDWRRRRRVVGFHR